MTQSRRRTPAKTQAFELFKSGQLPKAKALCQSYCKETANDPEAWCLLSTINGALGLNEEAEQCGRRAIALAPEYIPAHYNTAVALLHLRKPDEAVACFQKVIEQEPNNGIAHYLMGKCLELQVDRDDEALASNEKAMHTIPAPPRELFLDLENLYERVGRTDEARQCLDHFLRTHPGDPMAGLRRARMDDNSSDLDAACARLEGLLNSETALSPTEQKPLFYTGSVWYWTNSASTSAHTRHSEKVSELQQDMHHNTC